MRKFRNILAALAIFAVSFPMAACNKKETLDRVGAVLVQGVSVYRAEIAALAGDSRISPEKFARLDEQSKAIETRAGKLNEQLRKLGEVNSKDAAAILTQVNAILAEVQGALSDPEITKLGSDAKVITGLSWARTLLNNVVIALLVFFPAQGQPQGASRDIPTAAIVISPNSPPVHVSKIEVNIPPKPKGY